MPVARFQMPDGRIGRFEVPEGTTPEAAQSLIETHLSQQQAPPPAALEPNLWQQARPYIAPVVEGVGAAGGAILGGAGGTLAAPVAGTVGGAMLGGGLGYGAARQLMELGDVYLGGEAPRAPAQQAVGVAKDVLTGAAFEGGGQAIAQGLRGIREMHRARIDKKAADLIRKTAGQDMGEITRAVRQSVEAGGDETVGQAVSAADVIHPPIQSLQKRAAEEASTKFARLADKQEAARRTALEGITPDLKKAEAARSAKTDPLYEAADKTIVKMDDEMLDLFKRMPKGVLRQAAETARIEGRPFVMGQMVPEQIVPSKMVDASGRPLSSTTVPAEYPKITGESLHYIKRALSDILNKKPIQGASQDTQRAVGEFLPEFLTAFEKRVPSYGEARAGFAELSAPVNQAKLLREGASVLDEPLTGGERPAAFMNALDRGFKTLTKRSGAQLSGTIENALTPEQMSVVNRLRSEFQRDARMLEQAGGGTKEVGRTVAEASQPAQVPWGLSTVVSAVNAVSRKLQGKVNEKTIKRVADAMLSGRNMLELLNEIPASERGYVMQTIKASRGMSTVAGSVNALTSQQQNQNALTQ